MDRTRARCPASALPRDTRPLTGPGPDASNPVVHLETTSVSDVSPDWTFRELTVEAVGLLRGRMRRRWAVHLRRGDEARRRRRRLECLALLALTAVVSVSTAWAVWHTAADYRLRFATSSPSAPDVLEVELEEPRRDHRLEATASAGNGRSVHARQGQPGTVRDFTDEAVRSAGREDQALEVDGPALGVAAACTTLVVGWTAGRWVLRRFPDDDVTRDDANARADQAPVEDRKQPVPADPAGPDARVPDDVPGQEDERPGEGPPRAEDADAHASSGQEAPVDAPRSAAAAPPVPPEAGGFTPPTYVARERLYEARKAPRVAVRLESELRWLGDQWPITVTALSSDDLTFQVSTRPSVPGRRAPLTGGDHVRVVFPGSTGPLETSGQLAWQRAGAGGWAAGMRFTRLPAAELEDVLAVCAAHAARVT